MAIQDTEIKQARIKEARSWQPCTVNRGKLGDERVGYDMGWT
jgi:hypothetical protein